MANITIKNVPEKLYRQVKASAAAHHRSVNSEVIVCLEKALTSRPVDPDSFLAEVRALRASLGKLRVTGRELGLAKRSGRP